jgi:hypothetical protein
MADASESRLKIGAPVEKRGHGRPRGSKNKTTAAAVVGEGFRSIVNQKISYGCERESQDLI